MIIGAWGYGDAGSNAERFIKEFEGYSVTWQSREYFAFIQTKYEVWIIATMKQAM